MGDGDKRASRCGRNARSCCKQPQTCEAGVRSRATHECVTGPQRLALRLNTAGMIHPRLMAFALPQRADGAESLRLLVSLGVRGAGLRQNIALSRSGVLARPTGTTGIGPIKPYIGHVIGIGRGTEWPYRQ